MTTIPLPTAEEVWAAVEAKTAQLAERMPTEKDAIRVTFDAYQRLKDLGWSEGQHMPADGKRYAGIASGSTGIHAYTADRLKDGSTMYMVYDGDIWPTRTPPVLFRPWAESDLQMQLRPTYLGMLGDAE